MAAAAGRRLNEFGIVHHLSYCGTDDPGQKLDIHYPFKPVKAPVPVVNPQTGKDLYLQNYSFDYKGLHIICSDWSTRTEEGLLEPEQACGQCHTDVEYVVGRVDDIQDQVYAAKIAAEDAIIDAINALTLATAIPSADASILDEARSLHRHAQMRWDFVSAENSTGFHNPEYALSILAEATNLARQAQMKAAQSVGDTSLLPTGYYYTITPPPTPEP